jgi:DNA-binding transcriptional LysR family regulator
LRFFVEVVRQGGFSAAARVLFATQSTVSKAVQQLEAELGFALLRRLASRIELTEAGRLVHDRGLRLLADSAALRADLGALNGVCKGTLALGFPRVGTSSLFARALASFRQRHPDVDVHIVVNTVPQLLKQLEEGDIALAALFEPAPEMLEFKRAVEDELWLLLPQAHPLAAEEAVGLDDLQQLPLVVFDDDVPAAARVLRELERLPVRPTIFARTSQLELIFELVGTGAAAGFVPRSLALARPHVGTRAVPLAGLHIPWCVGFGWLRGRELSLAARAWIDHLPSF